MKSKFKGNMDRRNILKGIGVAGLSTATVGVARNKASVAQNPPLTEDASMHHSYPIAL